MLELQSMGDDNDKKHASDLAAFVGQLESQLASIPPADGGASELTESIMDESIKRIHRRVRELQGRPFVEGTAPLKH